MTAKPTRVDTHPVRSAVMAGVVLSALVVAGVLGREGVRAMRGSTQGRQVRAAIAPRLLPDTPAYLFVGLDDLGRAATLTVLGPSTTGSGGLVLVVPVSASLALGSGSVAVGDRRLDGPEALATAVGSLLGIEFAGTFEANETLLRSTFPTATTATVIRLTSRPLQGQESAQLFALVDAWKTVLAASPSSSPSPSTDKTLGALATLAQGKTDIVSLDIRPLTPGQVTLDGIQIRELMAERLPGSVSPPNTSLRFEIRDPFHNPAVRRELLARLAFIGANVVWVHEVDDPPTVESLITYENTGRRVEVEEYRKIVGASSFGLSTQPVDNVDVTVTIGQTLIDAVNQSLSTSTTTTTSTTTK